jgi:hypothetical protein
MKLLKRTLTALISGTVKAGVYMALLYEQKVKCHTDKYKHAHLSDQENFQEILETGN